jgi:hypothetical protein
LVDLEWVSGVTDEPSLLLQNGRGGRQQYGIRPAEPSGFGGAGRGDAVVDVPLDNMGVRCRTRMLATFELPVLIRRFSGTFAGRAGLEEQGQGALVVGIRSEAARSGGILLCLPLLSSWLFHFCLTEIVFSLL